MHYQNKKYICGTADKNTILEQKCDKETNIRTTRRETDRQTDKHTRNFTHQNKKLYSPEKRTFFYVSKTDQASNLTLKVLVMTIDAQWEGMGDVGSARYEPALLPPCPTIRVLSYSN